MQIQFVKDKLLLANCYPKANKLPMNENCFSKDFSDDAITKMRQIAVKHMAEVFNYWAGYKGQEKELYNEKHMDDLSRFFCDQLNPFKNSPYPLTPTDLSEFMAGLYAYLNHPARQERKKLIPIWQKGTTKLLSLFPQPIDKPAIFIIPSLINRYTIFDISPEHSFLGFLLSQGFWPVIVDWDEPGEEEKQFAISDYVTKRLIPALDFFFGMKKRNICLLGYCMGGLLALASALFREDIVNSIVLMATPWNFAATNTIPPQLAEKEAFKKLAEETEPYLANCGWFPADVLRIMFTSFQPYQVLEKFCRFANSDKNSKEAERFVLSEDWLNDGVPLSAPVARECLKDWYGENKPGRILWHVAGKLIDPRLLNCPAYVICPTKDKLVPIESSKPLARFIRNATIQEPDLGHIGLLTSGSAPKEIWKPLVDWLKRKKFGENF